MDWLGVNIFRGSMNPEMTTTSSRQTVLKGVVTLLFCCLDFCLSLQHTGRPTRHASLTPLISLVLMIHRRIMVGVSEFNPPEMNPFRCSKSKNHTNLFRRIYEFRRASRFSSQNNGNPSKSYPLQICSWLRPCNDPQLQG